MAKTMEKVDIAIGEHEFVITIKNKEIEAYKDLINKVNISLQQATAYKESIELLKDNIELFLGEGTFQKVFSSCEYSMLKTMNIMFVILEAVGNNIFEGETVEIPTEEMVEGEILPE
ncbi:hypothetical protein BMT55_16160 [Listeria newyorkensis]|uniref:Phage protein n=1 Tax=Listeria newyorkensis TaxID=1497681 RepID=A0ABX4XHU0_9LIST|nr:hypothetical protein [Listeria newyorkensis]PNP87457.1 hypothetical protein BMT55_16160 [Listeria newyorkensis]